MTGRGSLVCVIALAAALPATAAAATCEDLARLPLRNARVTSAQRVGAGGFSPPASGRGAEVQATRLSLLPPFCRVTITSAPSTDSDIRTEVWLPESGWNDRLQAVGDGGLAGSIPVPLMVQALADGYATAGTDTGHVGGNADFMPAHPEKLIDFAYRSTHELAVAAKATVAAYYGRPARWSYYNACSGGGRHAITSAQRYPADFNGIVAGAPTWDQARLDAGRIGVNLSVNRTVDDRIPPSKYPMIHEAALQACDGTDGVRDGIIGDPLACRFDYASLTCKGTDGPSCLTAAQVQSARLMTSPFKDPATGRVLLDVHLRPGTELQWATLGGPAPLANSVSRVRNFHLKDPTWEPRLQTIGADVDRAVRMDGGLLASNDFNLLPFFERGGKLLLWHGWSDPQVPADNTIRYLDGVRRTAGAPASNSIELFLLPGVLHCGGGRGADTFDKMSAITAWVERDRKPTRVVASHQTDGRVDRTSLVCPFGQVARYNGSGDLKDEVNYACVASTSGTEAR